MYAKFFYNRNIQSSKAPLKSQAQGASLFTSAIHLSVLIWPKSWNPSTLKLS